LSIETERIKRISSESGVLHYRGAGDRDDLWLGHVWVGVAAGGGYQRG